jgi:hypothetical protein
MLMDDNNSDNSNPATTPMGPTNSAINPVQKMSSSQPINEQNNKIPATNRVQSIGNAERTTKPTELEKPKGKKSKKILLIVFLVILFIGSTTGAYLFGRSNERIVVKEVEIKPLNLPPQAVLLEECTVGRGKQYILPKDIPIGPIYDVVNNKVVALEYNLNLKDIESNPDSLSNTILQLTRDYPVDHFSLVPAPVKEGEGLENILLIMFVVSKEEAKAITCE